MKSKSLQTSVSKRGARAESFLVTSSPFQCSQKLLKTLSFTLSNTGTVFEAGANKEEKLWGPGR